MSQVSSCPVTCTVVPSSRRHASRTVANASGSRSSRPAASSFLYCGLQLVEAALEPVPLGRIGAAVLGRADLLQLGLERAGALRETRPERRVWALSSSSVRSLSRSSSPWIGVDDRLDALALALEPRAEDRGHQCLDHSGSKYNRCLAMYSATASGTQ